VAKNSFAHSHKKRNFKLILKRLTYFTQQLINWYTEGKRDLPWRRTKNPYPIWLSEIILQQTRVEQGLPYWQKFMEEFPTIDKLAGADEDKVLRLWQGLGYYSRARNLHFTAKYITRNLKGQFPTSYHEIIKLKGIGPYTAAAIASICFNEPTPVVDGNVFRFASRYFGIKKDIAAPKTRKTFENLLAKEIDKDQPGVFNQAMMEFGATLCSPLPKCTDCIFQLGCYAYAHNQQKALPVKTKKINVSTRNFNYVVFRFEDSFLLKQRGPKDIWQGLYDFYVQEGTLNELQLIEKMMADLNIKEPLEIGEQTPGFKHILSHQKILARFFEVNLPDSQYKTVIQKTNLSSYSIEELLNLPKPKLIMNYLEKIGIK